MIRPLLALLLLPLALTAAEAPVQAAPRPALDRPNVVVILLDDAGYGDFEHNGNPTASTPQIARLAHQGASFTQFYTASPACSASRYSLLTGRVPGRSGLGSYVIGPESQRHLHSRETTLAEGLKARGYATGMFGKWHLGNPNAKNAFSPDALPLAHGFDSWIGTNVSHDYGNSMLLASDPAGTEPCAGYRIIAKDLPKHQEITDSLTQRYTEAALAFIRAKREQPFFAYVALNQPHLGLFTSPEFKGKSRRGLFGDVMAETDACVGSILKTLEEEGIAQNTLIVFSSDNGPWLRFMNDAKEGLNVGYAAPFRNSKGSNWEGGCRVPGLFYWPGTIPAQRSLEPASLLDVLPTVFAISGQPLPEGRSIDGRDIRQLLAPTLGGKAPADFVLTYPDSKNQPIAIRQGPWKLMTGIMQQHKDADGGFKASPQAPLLFQLEHDLGERFNRAATEPAKVAELKQVLEQRIRQIQDEGSFWEK
ncbi:MAG: Arylsulfatase precursor [Verrucomicrobiota bacterium]|jgi:arylsulfatase